MSMDALKRLRGKRSDFGYKHYVIKMTYLPSKSSECFFFQSPIFYYKGSASFVPFRLFFCVSLWNEL